MRTSGATFALGTILAAITSAALTQGPIDELQSVLQQRRAYSLKGNALIPPEERDYGRIVEVANAAMRIANEEGGLWRRIKIVRPDGTVSPRITIWYEWTSDILMDAAVSSRSPVDRKHWARAVEALAGRFLNERALREGIDRLRKQTARCADTACQDTCFLAFDFTAPEALREKARKGHLQTQLARVPRQDLEFTSLAANAQGHIESARSLLYRNSLLPADDWGVQAGPEWWNDSRTVQLRGGQIYLALDAFRKLGIPTAHSGSAIVIGRHPKLVRISITSESEISPQKAYRGSNVGSEFIPVNELHRAGILAVARIDKAQLVKLTPFYTRS